MNDQKHLVAISPEPDEAQTHEEAHSDGRLVVSGQITYRRYVESLTTTPM